MDKNKDTIFENHTEQQIIIAVNSLLDNLFDKDDSLRGAIEVSITKLTGKNADLILELILEFRKKSPKLDERSLSILFGLIESIVLATKELRHETMTHLSDLLITELIKFSDLVPAVQKPIIEVLISLGRRDCDVVMDSIIKNFTQGQVIHFMLLHCMGQLSAANNAGILKYLRNTFSTIISTLEMVKQDHLKQAYCFAVGRFCEAISENMSAESSRPEESLDFGSEIGIVYDTLVQHWLYSRESKVTAEVLLCLTHMFPLMRPEKVTDQIPKVIPNFLRLYRRIIDRVSVTQCLAAAIQTSLAVDQELLDSNSSSLIDLLFDLICVNPDYEKPNTIKGHYEVLRCFDLLAQTYEEDILAKLLVQMRSNMERERIKSLMLLVHFCSTKENLVRKKIVDFTKLLKQMISTEKVIKIKMALLKTIVAFAQRGLIEDKNFIKFVIRFACQPNRPSDFGTIEEQADFTQTCNNSIYILSTTLGTVDDILKRELLSVLMEQDYATIISTVAKSLAKLFEKSTDISTETIQDDVGNQISTLTTIPSPVTIFVRCLILLDNPKEVKRAQNILLFLKSYAPILNKHLHPLWSEKVLQMIEILNNKSNKDNNEFSEAIVQFLIETIKDVDEEQFSENLIEEMIKQHILYLPPLNPSGTIFEFHIPKALIERGNLFKMFGVALSQVKNKKIVEDHIEFMIRMAKSEKFDKNTPIEDTVIKPIAKGFGYLSRKHCSLVLPTLKELLTEEEKKKSNSGFFAHLNFVKEGQKEAEIYKVRTLVLESFDEILECSPRDDNILFPAQEFMIDILVDIFEGVNCHFQRKIIKILYTFFKNISELVPGYQLSGRDRILEVILAIDIDEEHLPLLSSILSLGTLLFKIKTNKYTLITSDHDLIKSVCEKFFSVAQQLKTEFDSLEDDRKNSFIAGHLNDSLPELNEFVKVILERNPTPACLDVVTTILETWTKDQNSQVRICASHLINAILDVYIKTMQIGGEAPSKFNQTGLMVGKTVPRCIDSSATVRQTSVDILRKILEISAIYETLTIPSETTDWVKELTRIKNEIITNDSNEIYKMANDIATIIASRLSNLQYMHFCRTLLYCINDPEQSSAIGASIVLRSFIKVKGHDLFHTIKDFVPECLEAIKTCNQEKARQGILKALVALAKHHPQQVCLEMLSQDIPFDAVTCKFWRWLAEDEELSLVVLDNFLNTLTTSCLLEVTEKPKSPLSLAALIPFKLFLALKEMLAVADMKTVAESRFAELFVVLLTSLPCYINVSPPLIEKRPVSDNHKKSEEKKKRVSENPLPSPCQIVLDIIHELLYLLKMEQLEEVFNIYPNLAQSKELRKFIEMIAPLMIAVGNTLGINSNRMKDFVNVLSRYTSSTFEQQRITAVATFSQLLTLNPVGDVLSTIMLHLNSALGDPNSTVQGCAIRGLGNLKYLNEYDVNSHIESSLMALINGLDSASGPLINIPIESMRGLCQIINITKTDKLKVFQINLAIRIKPFLDNSNSEMRDMTISLFGHLCDQEIVGKGKISEEFQEQIHKYLFPLVLHLSEKEGNIITASRDAIRKCVVLLKETPLLDQYIAENLLDYGQFDYDNFLLNLLKVIKEEFSFDLIQQFIESCLPHFKSNWPEIRGNSVIIVAVLGNHLNTNSDWGNGYNSKLANLSLDQLSQKIIPLIKDEHSGVKTKAALAMGHLFTNI